MHVPSGQRDLWSQRHEATRLAQCHSVSTTGKDGPWALGLGQPRPGAAAFLTRVRRLGREFGPAHSPVDILVLSWPKGAWFFNRPTLSLIRFLKQTHIYQPYNNG